MTGSDTEGAALAAIVVARMAGTGEQEGDKPRFSAFLVDLDSPGCRVEDGATRLSSEHIESDIVLDDCYVPAANLLGEEGKGLRIALGLLHCPTVLAATPRALQLTLDRTRKATGGQPLLMLQAIQHKVADMATNFYTARSIDELDHTTRRRHGRGTDDLLGVGSSRVPPGSFASTCDCRSAGPGDHRDQGSAVHAATSPASHRPSSKPSSIRAGSTTRPRPRQPAPPWPGTLSAPTSSPAPCDVPARQWTPHRSLQWTPDALTDGTPASPTTAPTSWPPTVSPEPSTPTSAPRNRLQTPPPRGR
ncbi:hypothetical protein [Streptomyces sp. HC307]|uniref:hypothetical protein n=1 Tax=Streptomyces flavusporus TaxID=3385496 RepID=UPI0039176377